MSSSFFGRYFKKVVPQAEYIPLGTTTETGEANPQPYRSPYIPPKPKSFFGIDSLGCILVDGLGCIIVLCFVISIGLFTMSFFSVIGGNYSSVVNYTVESLTRDVQIKAIHSHNDYWRQRPLYDALSVGAVSVEADIWHFPQGLVLTSTASTSGLNEAVRNFDSNELYVGHSLFYLKPNNTLNALYLDAIYNFLGQANPLQKYKNGTAATFQGEPDLNGVFFDFPDQQLYLWFDIKTDAEDTYKSVKPLLQRFIDKGYLTYYDTAAKKLVKGPVVLTLTGNLPTELVKAETTRYVFLDGSLLSFNLTYDASSASTLSDLAKLSLVASGSLQSVLGSAESYQNASRAGFTDEQKAAIQDHVNVAHKYGLKTRIWGGINWPNEVKLSQYKTYVEVGVDLLNVDDLNQAADDF